MLHIPKPSIANYGCILFIEITRRVVYRKDLEKITEGLLISVF